MRRRTNQLIIVIAGLAAAVAVPATAQAAPPVFTCEASALRGTILGQAIEPSVFGRGQECRTGQSVPTLSVPGLLDAKVLVAAGSKADDPLKPTASAAGGLAGARVMLLPSVPLPLPTDQILASIDAVAPISLPGLLTVDIREALRALLPLPQADLLSVGVLSSVAAASCDGTSTQPKLAGTSTITGLSVLGKAIDLDTPLQQNINLFDTASIKPSDIDISKLNATGPLGVSLPLTQTLQDLLRPILAGLPPIAVPPALAQVKISAKEQTKDATSLTQRALRVQVSLLTQSLLDVVIGEAKVSAVGDCPVPVQEEPAELQCTDRKLVLVDVFQQGNKGIKLKGAANKDFAGKTVSIRFQGDGNKVVATAKVGKNGGFSTFAPIPRKSVKNTNEARYTAVRGNEKSLSLKLTRRMRVSRVLDDKKQVTITGFVRMPLAAPAATINLRQRIQCGKQKVIATTKPNSKGRYTFKVKSPDLPAVYRATTRVRNNTGNPKTYPTFTLPRGVDLLKR